QIAQSGEGFRHKQFYWPDTNILISRFMHDDGVGEIEDYMPVAGTRAVPDELVRRVRVVRGKITFRLECRPAFDYARAGHETNVAGGMARFDGPRLSLSLAAPVPLEQDADGAVADFMLEEGQKATFVLRRASSDDDPRRCPDLDEAEALFRDTASYWQRWLSRCTYTGRW